LALGKTINNINKLSQTQLDMIDELLVIGVNFKCVIFDLE